MISRELVSTMCFLFKNYSLVEAIYLLMLIICNKIKNNTDKNGVNKQPPLSRTHTYKYKKLRKR